MKPSILGLLAGSTLLAGSALAEIKLTNGDMPTLSISGWIDSNYVTRGTDNNTGLGGGDADFVSLNEVEIDFILDFGKGLTARFDLDYEDPTTNFNNGPENDVELEQAFFAYNVLDGEDSSLTITVGRALSWTGWESADLVNLYQFSYGYAAGIGGYQDGIRAEYTTDMFSLGAAVVDDAYAHTALVGSSEMGYEFKAAFTGVENLTIFGSFIIDQQKVGEDTEAFDLWISYQLDKLLLAAEYSTVDDFGVVDSDAYLLMANYTVNDWLGFTVRYSSMETELSAGGANISEVSEYTFAVLLKAHENLGIILEYRHDEEDVGAGDEADTFAIEATLTF
jgi:hypothetical protein